MKWFEQNNRKTLLGQLLLDKKLISQEQLAQAIELQQKTGQRLGDAIASLQLISRMQLDDVLRRQRRLRMAASVAAALMGPVPVLAAEAAAAPVAPTVITQSTQTPQRVGGLKVLSEKELSETVGQGALDDALGDLLSLINNKFGYTPAVQKALENQNEVVKKPTSGLKVLGDLGKLLNPVLMMLSSDMTIKDVVYSPEGSKTVINKDGSITLSLPSTIGEIRFDNIRVRGNTTGPSFGSIAIRDIDMRGTTVTVSARR